MTEDDDVLTMILCLWIVPWNDCCQVRPWGYHHPRSPDPLAHLVEQMFLYQTVKESSSACLVCPQHCGETFLHPCGGEVM